MVIKKRVIFRCSSSSFSNFFRIGKSVFIVFGHFLPPKNGGSQGVNTEEFTPKSGRIYPLYYGRIYPKNGNLTKLYRIEYNKE